MTLLHSRQARSYGAKAQNRTSFSGIIPREGLKPFQIQNYHVSARSAASLLMNDAPRLIAAGRRSVSARPTLDGVLPQGQRAVNFLYRRAIFCTIRSAAQSLSQLLAPFKEMNMIIPHLFHPHDCVAVVAEHRTVALVERLVKRLQAFPGSLFRASEGRVCNQAPRPTQQT